jgi:hypothetical protein
LYRLDPALAGCFEMFYPSDRAVAMAAQDEPRHGAALSPAQYNAGLAAFYAISGRWQRRAHERLACAD